jgi:transmembrane sensor
MSRSEKSNDIDAIAAGWAVRSAEGLSSCDRRDLDAWLDESPLHAGAYIRARAIWVDVDRVAALERGASAMEEPPPRRLWLSRRFMAVAASILMIVLVGGGLIHHRLAGRYVAGQGEVLRVALDDSSTVMLNTDSVMQVKFDEEERGIVLRDGEASFNVAHDLSRPFVVHARDVTVRAVGTQFAVRMTKDAVFVTVTEGVVEVLRADGEGEPRRQLIVKNDQMVVPEAEPMVERELTPEQVSRDLSWRDGLLVFDGETLAAAAAEVNRYSSVPVTIDDPALANEAFVGVFRIGNTRAFASAAADAFDARIVEGPDGIRLSSAKNPTID